MAKKELWIGAAVGAAAMLSARIVLPIVGAVARPLARELIKVVLIAAERARTRGAVALESLDDLIAEAREDARVALGEDERTSERAPSEHDGERNRPS